MIQTRTGGAWSSGTTVWVRVAGVWKSALATSLRVAGVWQSVGLQTVATPTVQATGDWGYPTEGRYFAAVTTTSGATVQYSLNGTDWTDGGNVQLAWGNQAWFRAYKSGMLTSGLLHVSC